MRGSRRALRVARVHALDFVGGQLWDLYNRLMAASSR